jgi:hypothetical protein
MVAEGKSVILLGDTLVLFFKLDDAAFFRLNEATVA